MRAWSSTILSFLLHLHVTSIRVCALLLLPLLLLQRLSLLLLLLVLLGKHERLRLLLLAPAHNLFDVQLPIGVCPARLEAAAGCQKPHRSNNASPQHLQHHCCCCHKHS